MSLCGCGKMMLFLMFLLGCDPEKVAFEQESEELLVDFDQDGFSVEDDCDDWDNTIYPDAEEICDALDNNCDGQIDEGVSSIFYPDLDVDGFGDENAPLSACSPPESYIVVGNDCDDNDPPDLSFCRGAL